MSSTRGNHGTSCQLISNLALKQVSRCWRSNQTELSHHANTGIIRFSQPFSDYSRQEEVSFYLFSEGSGANSGMIFKSTKSSLALRLSFIFPRISSKRPTNLRTRLLYMHDVDVVAKSRCFEYSSSHNIDLFFHMTLVSLDFLLPFPNTTSRSLTILCLSCPL